MKALLALSLVTLILAACAGPGVTVKPVTPPALLQPFTFDEPKEQVPQPQGILSVVDALQLALQHNPQLLIFSLEKRAREAAVLQASLRPNPEVEVELENFAGGGEVSGLKGSEWTLSLGQLIELAGKRTKRTTVAHLNRELAEWDFESKRLEVYAQVVQAFTNVLAAQKQLKLNQEILDLAQKFKDQVAFRVEKGRTSTAELARAEVEVARAKVALQQSERQFQITRLQLATTWGATQATFDSVRGHFEKLEGLPPLNAVLAALQKTPQWTRWLTEQKSRQAQLALERALKTPDPVLRAGYRRINELNTGAFVAGLSIPLTIFDRNQGNIQQAAIRLKQTAHQASWAQLQMQNRATMLYQNMAAVYRSVLALKQEIIPQAQKAFQTINRGYQLGKFNFLEVLDARRSLFSARKAYLEQIAEYHRLRIELERLVGQSLQNL